VTIWYFDIKFKYSTASERLQAEGNSKRNCACGGRQSRPQMACNVQIRNRISCCHCFVSLSAEFSTNAISAPSLDFHSLNTALKCPEAERAKSRNVGTHPKPQYRQVTSRLLQPYSCFWLRLHILVPPGSSEQIWSRRHQYLSKPQLSLCKHLAVIWKHNC
jgi:hypothetical protein